MSWRRDPWRWLVAGAVVPGLLFAAPADADHRPDHTCGGSAEARKGSGEADGACEAPPTPTTGERVECDPDSTEVAYYADLPRDMPEERADRWVAIMIREELPEGMIWQAAFNCAGVLLGGPYLRPDPGWGDVAAVRDEARVRITPPLPAPNVSPAEAVVVLPTWLWVDEPSWQPASATATDGSVSVRVEARPVSVTWDLVEGTRTCDGPGIPWSQAAHDAYEAQPEAVRGRGNPACTFTFVHSSTTQPGDVYAASVTVTWEFAWWLNGQPRGVFGTVERTTGFDLRVGEIQALITDY